MAIRPGFCAISKNTLRRKPAAEKFYARSPYNAMLDNPVKYVDPDGRTATDWYIPFGNDYRFFKADVAVNAVDGNPDVHGSGFRVVPLFSNKKGNMEVEVGAHV